MHDTDMTHIEWEARLAQKYRRYALMTLERIRKDFKESNAECLDAEQLDDVEHCFNLLCSFHQMHEQHLKYRDRITKRV